MIRPTLRQLSYLVALQDEQSFSKAAEYCCVTQSTLSAGIKDLENILGQVLVNRKGRVISLTAPGIEVANSARKILKETDELVFRARQSLEPLCGPLRLGVIPTIAPYLLPKILPRLQEKFPKLELQIFEDLTKRLLEKIELNQVDAILIAFPFETPGLEQRLLFEENFVLASPRGEGSSVKNKIGIGDLSSDNLLLLEDGHCLREHALSACKLQPPKTRKTFSATSLPTLIQMVEHNYGHTLLPEMVINNAPLSKNIRITEFKKPAPKRQIGMAWSQNSPYKKDLNILFDFIHELLNKPKSFQ